MKIHSGVWKLKAKNLQNCQFFKKKWPNFDHKWPNFDHFWPFWWSKNFSTEKFFGGHLSHMETQLHAKN